MLRHIIKDHTPYFVYYAAFLFVGLFYHKTTPEETAILFFSDHRSEYGNVFFTYCTHLGEFAPYLITTLFFLWKRRKYAWTPIATAGLVMLCSYYIKDYMGHPRPVMFFESHGLIKSIHFVPGVTILRGYNSFPSGHTMSAFAIYSLLCFTVGKNVLLQLLFFTLAVLVGVSRIYLVEHFPEDVLFGSLLGLSIAVFVYYIYSFFHVEQRVV